ncbi:MAG: hypothetical protein WCK48_03110 [bacterium]
MNQAELSHEIDLALQQQGFVLPDDMQEDFKRDEELVTGNGNHFQKRPGGTSMHLTHVSRSNRPVIVHPPNMDEIACDDQPQFGMSRPAIEYLGILLKSLSRDERRVVKALFLKKYGEEIVAEQMGISVREVKQFALLGLHHMREMADKLELTLD